MSMRGLSRHAPRKPRTPRISSVGVSATSSNAKAKLNPPRPPAIGQLLLRRKGIHQSPMRRALAQGSPYKAAAVGRCRAAVDPRFKQRIRDTNDHTVPAAATGRRFINPLQTPATTPQSAPAPPHPTASPDRDNAGRRGARLRGTTRRPSARHAKDSPRPQPATSVQDGPTPQACPPDAHGPARSSATAPPHDALLETPRSCDASEVATHRSPPSPPATTVPTTRINHRSSDEPQRCSNPAPRPEAVRPNPRQCRFETHRCVSTADRSSHRSTPNPMPSAPATRPIPARASIPEDRPA